MATDGTAQHHLLLQGLKNVSVRVVPGLKAIIISLGSGVAPLPVTQTAMGARVGGRAVGWSERVAVNAQVVIPTKTASAATASANDQGIAMIETSIPSGGVLKGDAS